MEIKINLFSILQKVNTIKDHGQIPVFALLNGISKNSLFKTDIEWAEMSSNEGLIDYKEKNRKNVVSITPSKFLMKVYTSALDNNDWLRCLNLNTLLQTKNNGLKDLIQKNSRISKETIAEFEKYKYFLSSSEYDTISAIYSMNCYSGSISENFANYYKIALFYFKYNDSPIMKWDEICNYTEKIPAFENIPECKVQIYDSDKIKYAYLSSNYHRIEGGLGNSCMSHSQNQSYINFYAENPEKVKILVLLDSKDKIMARSLIWNTDEGEVLVDRRYVYNNKLNSVLDKVCAKFGCVYRPGGHLIRELFRRGESVHRNFTVTMSKSKNRHFPFLDTFFVMKPLDANRVKLFTSTIQIDKNDSTSAYSMHSANGQPTNYYFNTENLLKWEKIDLFLSNDKRIQSNKFFINEDISAEERIQIIQQRKDLTERAIWEWNVQDGWLDFIYQYPDLKEKIKWETLSSEYVNSVFNYCLQKKRWKLFRLCNTKEMEVKHFRKMFIDSWKHISPSELWDNVGKKMINPLSRTPNTKKADILLEFGKRFKEDNKDYKFLAELIIPKLKPENIQRLILNQPQWKKYCVELNINIEFDDEIEKVSSVTKKKKKTSKTLDDHLKDFVYVRHKQSNENDINDTIEQITRTLSKEEQDFWDDDF